MFKILTNYIKIYLKFLPLFYKFYCKFKKNDNKVVNQNTDLILEGYPRCGNTFSFFLLLNLKNIKIAHHTHSLTNVKLGIKRELPICILIRNPYEAISSEIIRKTGFNENLDIDSLINSEIIYYKLFYKYIKRNINKLIICDFDILINSPSKFLTSINNELLKHDIGILFSNEENINNDKLKKIVKDTQNQIRKKENLKNLDSKSMSIPNEGNERYLKKKKIYNKIKKIDNNNKLMSLYLELKSFSI